ncbi:MAG: hypothetical protein H6732_18485 [Alphaproteobacteria bacterium]|nr:hypothetical protein [Alphaproteobacteria bacterium]
MDVSIRDDYLPDMPLDPNSLRDALETLGAILEDRGTACHIVVIGGGALLLVGLVHRSTKDLDVVALAHDGALVRASPFPPELAEAVRDVALALDLPEDWLNAGPADLLTFGLPQGFTDRTTVESFGALTVHVASRVDQVAFKLYAAADHWPHHGKHLQDLQALAPTPDELVSAARWCRTHDASEAFRDVQLTPVLGLFGVSEVPRG